MLPENWWWDYDTACARLNNSLIRYKEYPFYIDGVVDDEDGFLYLKGFWTNISGPKMQKVQIGDSELNFKPVPLGMYNSGNKLASLSRIPARQWKLGLSSSNIHIRAFSPNIRVSHNNVITTKPLAKTIMNEYPSFKEAEDLIKGFYRLSSSRKALAQAQGRALTRKWGVITSPNNEETYLVHSIAGKIAILKDEIRDPVFKSPYEGMKDSYKRALEKLGC